MKMSPFSKEPSLLPARRQFLSWGASVSRLRARSVRLGLATLAGSSLLFAGSLRANTELDVASGLPANSDLSAAGSYTGATAPTATSDVTFNGTNTYTSPYQFGSALTIGSFNDLTGAALTISGGGGTVTLAGGDSVSGNTGDLLYVASGANLTYSQNLTMGTTGNFDVVGAATLGYIADGSNGNSSAPTGTSSNLVKTGAGTLILTANNTYTGGTTVNAGTLQDNFGGQGYGALRGTVTVNAGGTLSLNAGDALGYNAVSAGNSAAQLNINGGTIDIKVNANEGFTANLTMTGGTFSSTGGGAFNINAGAANAPSINSLASATTSLISAGVVIRSGSNLPFNVASGTTASGNDLTITGAITQNGGNGTLTKNGAGTMLLTGTNTYAGPTNVTAGRLVLGGTGSLAAGSAVTVTGTGTIFGGSGTVGGTVNIGNGSTLTVRNRVPTVQVPGALTTGALTLQTGSTFNALLASNTSFSTLNAGAANTTVLGGAAFTIGLTTGATFTNGAVLELITSPVSGTFTNSFYSTGGYTFTADYTTNAGFFSVDVSAVPEPSTWAGLLAMTALAGGVYLRRRRQLARLS